MSEASEWLTDMVGRLEKWQHPSAVVIARVEHVRSLLIERTEMKKLLTDVITDWESDWEGKPQGQVSDAVLERIRTMLWPLPPLPEAPR